MAAKNPDILSENPAVADCGIVAVLQIIAKATGISQTRSKECKLVSYDTIRYDMRCYYNVRSKADISRLNLPHGDDN